MNEARLAEENSHETPKELSQTPTENEKIDLQEGGECYEAEGRENEADLGVSLDTDAGPDPDPISDPAEAQAGRLDQLRGELIRLQEALAQREAHLARIEKEYEEFRALFPDVALSALTDAIWKDVENGNSLAAAFALAERRRVVTEEKAALSNKENRERSAGAMKNAQNEYFSPDEVRAMSSGEVRKNYQKIMRSMQSWR